MNADLLYDRQEVLFDAVKNNGYMAFVEEVDVPVENHRKIKKLITTLTGWMDVTVDELTTVWRVKHRGFSYNTPEDKLQELYDLVLESGVKGASRIITNSGEFSWPHLVQLVGLYYRQANSYKRKERVMSAVKEHSISKIAVAERVAVATKRYELELVFSKELETMRGKLGRLIKAMQHSGRDTSTSQRKCAHELKMLLEIATIKSESGIRNADARLRYLNALLQYQIADSARLTN